MKAEMAITKNGDLPGCANILFVLGGFIKTLALFEYIHCDKRIKKIIRVLISGVSF